MSRVPLPLRIVLLLVLVGVPGVTRAEPSLPQATPTPPLPGDPDAPPLDPATVQSVTLAPVATRTGVAELVSRVDGNRWHADVTTLARFGASTSDGWGTRRSLTTGNLAARDWIAATLTDLGWTTSLQSFFLIGGTSYNVIGERVGYAYPDDIYIVGAHMDSTSSQAWTLAPGAEDNASGTAALLEIARVLQDRRVASTIRLIAFSGEEQGLVGSDAYVSYLQSGSRELDRVKGVYIMDMIGYTSHPFNLHVVLESRNPDLYPWMGDMRDHLAAMAGAYTTLRVYTSNSACCSDHAPFLYRQVPAVLLIAAEAASYPYYHSTEDLPSRIVPAQGAEIVKLVVAALADRPGVICLLADLDCDDDVDLVDLGELASHWRVGPGDPGYETRYDLNRDGAVNVVDVQLAALDLGR